jgi:hypothetical protein
MNWQILIWNIFVWSFMGVMIYITKSSLWWLLLPAMLTGTQSASELVKAVNEADKKEELDDEIDQETLEQMKKLRDSVKKGDRRREWV